MTEEPNSRFSRPPRAERKPGEPRNRNALPKHRTTSPNVTPEMIVYLKANAATMTAIDLAFALDISEPHVRKLCNKHGLTWRNGWRGDPPPENAHPHYEPEALPEGVAHRAPAGTRQKVIDMRQRAEKGLPLWDANDDARGLPQCRAKIVTKGEGVL